MTMVAFEWSSRVTGSNSRALVITIPPPAGLWISRAAICFAAVACHSSCALISRGMALSCPSAMTDSHDDAVAKSSLWSSSHTAPGEKAEAVDVPGGEPLAVDRELAQLPDRRLARRQKRQLVVRRG